MSHKIDCLFISPRDQIGAWPYLKSAYMAGELETHSIVCKIIDPAIEVISLPKILAQIELLQPKIICIGVFPSTLPDAFQLIQAIQKAFPAIIIVVEGYQINADPNAVRELGVAYGFRGDVEQSFASFCQSILSRTPIDTTLPGLVYFEGSELKTNKYAIVKHLDELADPAFDLLPIGKYYSASSNQNSMVMYASRGCPYECSFCANPSQLVYRYFSTDKVVSQLKYLVNELNVRWIEFLDLIFTINKTNTKELCEAIIQADLKFEWACQTRVDVVNEDLLRLMRKAGCKKIAFGVESGNENLRALSGKKISNKTLEETFALCNRIGIHPMAYFVMGHPGETAKEVRETIDFALRLNPFNAVFIKMIPLPDIDIFQTAVAEGVISPNAWYDYMHGTAPHPRYVPPTITLAEADKLYQQAYLRFYFRWATIRNYLPLFINPFYLLRTARFFVKIVFGKDKFSYC